MKALVALAVSGLVASGIAFAAPAERRVSGRAGRRGAAEPPAMDRLPSTERFSAA